MTLETKADPEACAYCGGKVLPGRRYRRPSCRVRHEHQQRAASLPFPEPMTLESEWPPEDDAA